MLVSMSRQPRTSHRSSRRYTTNVDELVALRHDIDALRRVIRAAFERGATSDDCVVVAAVHVIGEREGRLEQLEAGRQADVDPRAA